MKTTLLSLALLPFASSFAFADYCSFNASVSDPVIAYSCNGAATRNINSAQLKVDANDALQITSAAMKHFADLGYTVVSCSQRSDDALNCIVRK